jgi:hypothetical protein
MRPLGEVREAGSQLHVFEATLTLLSDRASAAPVLLVLEDLHWADTSTLDLVVWLAHNVEERRVVLLGTYRPDERASAERVRRLADGVRRSGSALVLELGPLEREETAALLAAHDAPAALADAIIALGWANRGELHRARCARVAGVLARLGRFRGSRSRNAEAPIESPKARTPALAGLSEWS